MEPTSGNTIWFIICIPIDKGLIGIPIDLLGSGQVRSRTGSGSRFEDDPGRLGSPMDLNLGYVVEDFKAHHLQKESSHLVR
jgi:hypothetical protein